MSGFVHLRVHTEYSLVDSVVRVDALVDAAAELRMPACAITDQGNVSALVKFYKLAFEKGVKPIMGADVWIAESREDRDPARCTLLCQNRTGFKRLSSLLTKSAVLGLVAGRHVLLKEWLERWHELLPGRFYIELQRLGRPGEHEYLSRAVDLAAAKGVPVVATNEVCFLGRGGFV